MNTKDFTDPDQAIDFVKGLQENNTVDVLKLIDGTFRINWLEHKKYTTYDGKEYSDEVWTKEDGTMIACQDLELEHAKNIIRMMLRQDRERRAMEAQLYEQMQSALSSLVVEDDDEELEDDVPDTPRVLH
jgi:hypothetical protein